MVQECIVTPLYCLFSIPCTSLQLSSHITRPLASPILIHTIPDVVTMTSSLFQVRHVLTFWRDGFSVDDGPLRTGDTPEDKTFIDGVRRG